MSLVKMSPMPTGKTPLFDEQFSRKEISNVVQVFFKTCGGQPANIYRERNFEANVTV